MASRIQPDINITSFKGGQNDQDPPTAIADDQVVLAQNVEFFQAPLGERRKGCVPIDITGSGLDLTQKIVHLGVHYPQNTEINQAELIVLGAIPDSSLIFAHRDSGGEWTALVSPDTFDNSEPNLYKFQSQSIHGKWFVAGKSNVDRLHVHIDGNIRRVGLAAPTGPVSAADEGSGSFSDPRTYRVRVIEKSGSKILRRSEPSEEYTFTPSGSGAGATITISSTPPGEGETDWEIEASDGDGNFYIIATQAIATTTYTDTTQPATDYAANILSADIGTYALIPSVQFIKADQDRLIFGGSWEDPEKGSRFSWTPVWNDPGFGNDERMPANIDSFIDLDWSDGGNLTGLSDPLNGSLYVFKWSRIYKIQRTGDFTQAYQAFLISPSYGALPGSIISGTDEFGRGCVYFLDPSIGPMRVGASGVQYIKNIRGTWRTVNTNASNVISHGLYHRDKQQILWWVASGQSNFPNLGLRLQVSEIRSDQDGTNRGWSTFTGHYAEAVCSLAFPVPIQDGDTGALSLSYEPHVGLDFPSLVQKGDSSNTDDGQTYRAVILSKPFIVADPLNRWGAMNAVVLGAANSDERIMMEVSFIRDFGLESNSVSLDFRPDFQESIVIKRLDNLAMSNATAIQIQFADPE